MSKIRRYATGSALALTALVLSGCYYAPPPGYAYGPAYYPAPAYGYAPYGGVAVDIGGGWHRHW
jgi:hypothetical protein